MPEPQSPDLPRPQIEALLDELESFDASMLQQGGVYAAEDRVQLMELAPGMIRARVRGNERYETMWSWTSDEWYCDCSCPIGIECKHAAATGLVVLKRMQAFLADSDMGRRADLLLRVVPRKPPAGSSASARAAAAGEVSLVEQLRRPGNIWTRIEIFGKLIAGAPVRGLSGQREPFHSILENERNANLMFWRLAREVSRLADGWVPDELRPFVERPDLEQEWLERARSGLLGELTEWSEQRQVVPLRTFRIVLGLIEINGTAAVTAEGRVTSARLEDEPRNIQQLTQLQNECQSQPGILLPEQATLLRWLLERVTRNDSEYTTASRTSSFVLSGTQLRAVILFAASSALVTWGPELTPDLAQRAGLKPNAPLCYESRPQRILPSCTEVDGEVSLEFGVVSPEGELRSLDKALYLPGDTRWGAAQSHPSFVIVDGAISAVSDEPPLALLRRFDAARGLPLHPVERNTVLYGLAATFPHLRPIVAAHTHFHPAQAVVALDLREDDWLQVRLFSRPPRSTWLPGNTAGPGEIIFEWETDGRWRRCDSQASSDAQPVSPEGDFASVESTPSADVPAALPTATVEAEASNAAAPPNEPWMEQPDAAAVEPMQAWVEAFGAVTFGTPPANRGLTWPDRAVGRWLRLTAKTIERMSAVWQERPAEAAYFGTPRLRRLLGAGFQISPKLHIESSGVDWFAVSTEWQADGLDLNDDDLAQLRSSSARFVRLSSGWVQRETAKLHDEAAAVLADLGIEAGAGPQRLSLWQLASANPNSLGSLEHYGADAATLEAVRQLRQRVVDFKGLPVVAPPNGLRADLRPYQRRGLDFLAYTSSLGAGAILADDMGLGKTVQALAWLMHLRESGSEGPSLVVCPASVVHNWAREAERFAPDLRIIILASGEARKAAFDQLSEYDVIVTNYALLRRDIEIWRKTPLLAAILDEAQNIKNPDAAVSRAAQALQANHRLALTGTPLENRALDLWSILQFANPGYLGTRTQFQSRFDRIDAPPYARSLLTAKLRPVLLRRTKREVAPELPPRIEERIDCEMTKEQRLLYLAEARRSRTLVNQLADEPGGIAQNKIHILAALTRLRQICCHPALAGGKASLSSGKFETLFEMLEPLLAEGHKVLLFSQFVECLKLIEQEFVTREIPYHMLTGATKNREEVVDAFQNDERAGVFLISLRAGGTGLNLTAATYVILFDPWWNPAVEAQAIDRTHRIGQDRSVIAYRMLSVGTIEEKIWELQQRKATLSRDVLGGEDSFARSLTREDLNFLLEEV